MWGRAFDTYAIRNVLHEDPEDLIGLSGCHLLGNIPNWPAWGVNTTSGVKWYEHFAPTGTSPRSNLLIALTSGLPKTHIEEVAENVLQAWSGDIFSKPWDRKRK